MAVRGKAKAERDLCVYIAEAGDDGVKENVIRILTQCIQDKIFSANEDTLCVTRDDWMSEMEFSGINWDILRKVDVTFRQPRDSETKPKPIRTLAAICESVEIQALDDTYQNKKILFFGDFFTPLKDKELERFARQIEETRILLTIVVPDKSELNEIQTANVELLKRSFENNNTVYVSYMKEAAKHLANTLSKKPIRPTPWNIIMDIGPSLNISCQSFTLLRKNTSTELKAALEKSIVNLAKPRGHSQSQSSQEPGTSGTVALRNGGRGGGAAAGSSTDLVPVEEPEVNPDDLVFAKDEVKREITWRQTDGSEVDPSDIGEGYFYGERLIQLDETDQANSYKSGDKCLKILVFIPKENIKPCYILGNGMDLVLANKKDPGAELKFDALLKAMHNTDRIAVVRKVRNNNAKLMLGILTPCMERKGLVFTEICFGDDISTPYFAPLIKEDQDMDEDGINEKDSVMDELIMAMSIDEFSPANGPVDPALQVLRDNVTRKILGKPLTSAQETNALAKNAGIRDNIDLFFESVVMKDDVATRLRELIPITEIYEKKVKKEEVVRKRPASPIQLAIKDDGSFGNPNPTSSEKKIKIENDPSDDAARALFNDEFNADFLVDYDQIPD